MRYPQVFVHLRQLHLFSLQPVRGRAEGAVFVHCNAGVSRAATVVIAYYMRTQGAPLRDAWEHVKSVRPCIRPNDGFRKQLEEYDPSAEDAKARDSA